MPKVPSRGLSNGRGDALYLLDEAFQELWKEAFRRELAAPFDLEIIDGKGQQVYGATLRENVAGELLDEVVRPERELASPRFPLTVVLRDRLNNYVEVIVPRPEEKQFIH